MVLAATLLCAGCSGAGSGSLQGLSTSSLQPPPSLASTQSIGTVEDESERLRSDRKTMAAKVLAAIALERVTGRKPDPGRLTESN